MDEFNSSTTELPVSPWGHAILHSAALVRLWPTANHQYSPLQLVLGHQPDVSHLRVFGCHVYVPVTPPQRTKFGPQRRKGIYVGFDSPSIIRYLEPLTGDIFTARFADCHFDETVFPPLGGELKPPEERGKLSWYVPTLSHLDPRTNQSEVEVQKIIHLQNIAGQMPDAFVDTTRITKSYIPAKNVPARTGVPVGQVVTVPANESSKVRLKRGRPIGSKDSAPRKRKGQLESTKDSALEETIDERSSFQDLIPPVEENAPEREMVPGNEEISINFACTNEMWDRNKVLVDDKFSFTVATEITKDNDDCEPQSIEECREIHDWPKWKDAINAELDSLTKRNVFGPVVQTPKM
ncbi:hypothetical protein OROMI_011169 [Orobanche minor]